MKLKKYYWDEFIEDIKESISSGQVMLDAGAGDCHWKEYFSDIKYIGLDLKVGDDNCNYSNLDLIGDLNNIKLGDSSVDIIICIQVLEHVSEPWNVLREFFRVLKSSGYLFLSCPQSVELHQVPHDYFRYTPFGLKSLLENSGFEIKWIKPQLGNFSKIVNDICYSLKKLPSISSNSFQFYLYSIFSFLIRQLTGKLIRPLLSYYDQFEELQDNSVGYFVKSRKL